MASKNDNNEAVKYFNQKDYSTIVLKNNAEKETANSKKSKNTFEETIFILLEANKIELLKSLKENKAQQELIKLISKTTELQNLAKLIALCWESGLDFSANSTLFFQYSLHEDVYVSLEALTVLENIDEFKSKQELESGIEQLKSAVKIKHPNSTIIEETRINLFEKLKSMP